MNSVNMEPDQWQMGKTKVFIKAPESVSNSILDMCHCLSKSSPRLPIQINSKFRLIVSDFH